MVQVVKVGAAFVGEAKALWEEGAVKVLAEEGTGVGGEVGVEGRVGTKVEERLVVEVGLEVGLGVGLKVALEEGVVDGVPPKICVAVTVLL